MENKYLNQVLGAIGMERAGEDEGTSYYDEPPRHYFLERLVSVEEAKALMRCLEAGIASGNETTLGESLLMDIQHFVIKYKYEEVP